MSKINTLAAGYKSHPTEVKSENSKPPVIMSPTQVDAIDITIKLNSGILMVI